MTMLSHAFTPLAPIRRGEAVSPNGLGPGPSHFDGAVLAMADRCSEVYQ
jgi:hypothetical protein